MERCSSAADPAKGDTTSVTGRLEKDKNQYVLIDTKSGISYRLVGLEKSEEAQRSPFEGTIAAVKLVVKSTESAMTRIAQLQAIMD